MTSLAKKLPDFDIAPVLEVEFGAENVPHIHGSGHRKLLCPFHAERTPSASVSQYGFRCFGCGVTGDAIALLKNYGGYDHAAAVARAEELAGPGGSGVPRAAGGSTGWWGSSVLG